MQVNTFPNIICLLILISLTFTAGCKKSESPSHQENKSVVQTENPVPTPIIEKEKAVYVYSGDRFRDPFIASGQSNAYQADVVFDPQKAVVKGIIFGPNQKSAFLSLGGGGSYYIKAGRIFDVMGKPVDGFSAKILVDRVILLGEADNTYELKLKKNGDDEEAKKS